MFNRPFLCIGFILSASAAAAWLTLQLWSAPGGALQDVARTCAVLAFLWTLAAAVVALLHGQIGQPDQNQSGNAAPLPAGSRSFVGIARFSALLLGVVAAIVQSVILAMRMIFVVTDLINSYTQEVAWTYGFGVTGLWSLGFLLAACLVASLSMRDRCLGTCAVCSAAMLASWACLLSPALRRMAVGGYERTGSMLLLLATLSVLLWLTAVITRAIDRYGSLESRNVDATGSNANGSADSPTDHVARSGIGDSANSRPWPGLTMVATVILVGVVLLAGYHLAVPIAVRPGGFLLTALVTTASSALAAWGGFLLVSRWWSAYLADAAMVLTTLALCGLATMAVPSQPDALAERYPLVFNAMIVGLAVATGLWTELASLWQRRRDKGGDWTTSSRLIPYARRFSFFSAALALVVGAMMALWPRWPTVSATDDSLGRVTAGVAANLFLLLVMLWCSRRLHKVTFQILTVLAVVSTAGFLLSRMLAFTPRFG